MNRDQTNAKQLANYHAMMKDPEVRARVRERQRANRALRLSDPAYRVKLKKMRRRYYDKEYENKIKPAKQTESYKSMRSKYYKVRAWQKTLWYSTKHGTKVKKLPASDISPEWILEQFGRQKGKCFYSGLDIVIDETNRGLRRPSLDRRDPKLGYTKENVVICLWAINMMKGIRSEQDLQLLLTDLRKVEV